MNGYPFFITTELIGGITKILMGSIVFLNISSFNPNPSEYIIIVMLCIYGIISGLISVSPYIDEGVSNIYQWVGFMFRSKARWRYK